VFEVVMGNYLRWLTPVDSKATTSPAALVMAGASESTCGARAVAIVSILVLYKV
jgi:hypothetical protein